MSFFVLAAIYHTNQAGKTGTIACLLLQTRYRKINDSSILIGIWRPRRHLCWVRIQFVSAKTLSTHLYWSFNDSQNLGTRFVSWMVIFDFFTFVSLQFGLVGFQDACDRCFLVSVLRVFWSASEFLQILDNSILLLQVSCKILPILFQVSASCCCFENLKLEEGTSHATTTGLSFCFFWFFVFFSKRQ